MHCRRARVLRLHPVRRAARTRRSHERAADARVRDVSCARPPATQFRYRAAPVFAAPPCPVELGADCVVLGPVAVDDVVLWWFHNIAARITTMTTTKAPMPHAARKPESVDVAGSVTRMPHGARRRRAGPVDVRGGSVGF